jgi:rubrerythrin
MKSLLDAQRNDEFAKGGGIDMKRCPECNTYIQRDASECPSCGKNMDHPPSSG